MARALGGRYFEYLMGRFTEPAEVFGPIDLRRLREGRVETETAGMLPEAEIAFLDEVFLGSTAILNTLLGVLNERTFRRGHQSIRCPLRVCVAASNGVPEDPALAAFADRFLLRVFVEPVADPMLEDLLEEGWVHAFTEGPTASITDLDALATEVRGVDVSQVRGHLADAVRQLRQDGLPLSDRRVVKMQSLVAAAAALDGRTVAEVRDLWPLVFAIPTREGQEETRAKLAALLSRTESSSLPAGAVDASLGLRARASLLIERATALLESASDAQTGRRAEGILREMDACFAPSELPEALADMRPALTERAAARTRDAAGAADA